MGAVLSIPRATVAGLPIPKLQVQTVHFYNVSGAGASVYPGVLHGVGLFVLCTHCTGLWPIQVQRALLFSATGAGAFSTQGYMHGLLYPVV